MSRSVCCHSVHLTPQKVHLLLLGAPLDRNRAISCPPARSLRAPHCSCRACTRRRRRCATRSPSRWAHSPRVPPRPPPPPPSPRSTRRYVQRCNQACNTLPFRVPRVERSGHSGRRRVRVGELLPSRPFRSFILMRAARVSFLPRSACRYAASSGLHTCLRDPPGTPRSRSARRRRGCWAAACSGAWWRRWLPRVVTAPAPPPPRLSALRSRARGCRSSRAPRGCQVCSEAHVANRKREGLRVGDRSRGRYATPADFRLHDGSSYRGLHVRRWGLGFVHHSRTILYRPVPNLNDTIRELFGRCEVPCCSCCSCCCSLREQKLTE
jgi:hypothetical protein